MQVLGSHSDRENVLSIYYEYQHPERLFGHCGCAVGEEGNIPGRHESVAGPQSKERRMQGENLEAKHF